MSRVATLALLLPLAMTFEFRSQAAEGSPSGQAAVKAVLDAEWERTVKGAGLYGSTLTVDLPASWPPKGDGRLSCLAYSYGLREGMPHGAVIGSLWGRIVLDTKTGKASFERLSRSTKELGIQGVQPMTQKESEISDTEAAAVAKLTALVNAKGAPKTADPVLRAFYCQWRSFGGVIAETLPSPEADFFRWLECDKRS